VIAFSREWAMPNKNTFLIKPISNLLIRYVHDPSEWLDPFSGDNSPAILTNDLNPDKKSHWHLPAIEFADLFAGNSIKGVLFDPPYSLRQLKECYAGIDKKMTFDESKDASFSKLKDKLSPKVKSGGCVISFGWSTVGFGKTRGFDIEEILLVCHGGHHNDTICTVERKVR